MKKLVLLVSAAAVALTAGMASAATVKNLDKSEATLHVTLDGKKEMLKLKENESKDLTGKVISVQIGKEKASELKADGHYVIKGGKFEEEVVKTETKTEPAATTGNNTAPVAEPVAPVPAEKK